MKVFHCTCGAALFFEYEGCTSCGREVGFLPDRRTLSALVKVRAEAELRPRASLTPSRRSDAGPLRGESAGDASSRDVYEALAAEGAPYRKCLNYARERVCNWMVPSGEDARYCTACRLNQTIPNLSQPQNRRYWSEIEAAKRRLVYSILRLGLPLRNRWEDPRGGLAFAFLERMHPAWPVVTGHAGGLITINVSEADELYREQARLEMHESYRTLLGHFRHEIGHYYWDKLVKDSTWVAPYRALFGDERAPYGEALERYYREGAPASWAETFISGYASSHPWEDWAETWAHYLHMTDTVESARAVGLSVGSSALSLAEQEALWPPSRESAADDDGQSFSQFMQQWVWLTIAMNTINRSMGMREPYPFVINARAAEKLRFVHDVITAVRIEGDEDDYQGLEDDRPANSRDSRIALLFDMRFDAAPPESKRPPQTPAPASARPLSDAPLRERATNAEERDRKSGISEDGGEPPRRRASDRGTG